MKLVLFFTSTTLLLICSCNTNSLDNKNLENIDNAEKSVNKILIDSGLFFEQRFGDIINTLGSKNFDELNKFISPQFGLLIIENEAGAMPQFRIQKTDDRDFNRMLEKIADNISFDRNLKQEPLPTIDCLQKSFYTKTGSFARDTNPISGSQIWKYGNLIDQEQLFAETAIESIGKTVITTYSYTYYFSYYNNNWYLTIIDIRKPCSA